MLRRLNFLRDCQLEAKDGAFGTMHDLYFDDVSWTVRYLVVDTAGWLAGQKVLISPIAIREVDPSRNVLPVELTKQQIEKRPSIESDRPVSRQYEIQYHQHFGWPYYWIGGAQWGHGPYAADLSNGTLAEPLEQDHTDPHLRSGREVTGYNFTGVDGDVGHVEDFVIDDRKWDIPYVVLDTRNWWPGGKKVLISRQWLDEIHWLDRTVEIGLSREQIRGAPGFDPEAPIDRSYEIALFSHYGREWAESPSDPTG